MLEALAAQRRRLPSGTRHRHDRWLTASGRDKVNSSPERRTSSISKTLLPALGLLDSHGARTLMIRTDDSQLVPPDPCIDYWIAHSGAAYPAKERRGTKSPLAKIRMSAVIRFHVSAAPL